MSIRFLLLFIFLIPFSERAFAIDIDTLTKENRLLKSELQLARKSDIYFIFNLIEKKVQFKAKGLVLKEFPIEEIKPWGSSVKPEPHKLIKKSALLKPKRSKIKPMKDDGDSFELNALELEDMPSRYCLTFEDDLRLYVRPKPKGVFSKIFYGTTMLKPYISRPVLSLWNKLRGKTFTEIDIFLNKKDARSLYWSFTEGLSCIIYDSR